MPASRSLKCRPNSGRLELGPCKDAEMRWPGTKMRPKNREQEANSTCLRLEVPGETALGTPCCAYKTPGVQNIAGGKPSDSKPPLTPHLSSGWKTAACSLLLSVKFYWAAPHSCVDVLAMYAPYRIE